MSNIEVLQIKMVKIDGYEIKFFNFGRPPVIFMYMRVPCILLLVCRRIIFWTIIINCFCNSLIVRLTASYDVSPIGRIFLC